jgi:large subunit ribosomal protein L24
MKIKKGDNVIVISGADKGHKGKVVRVFPKESKVLIEGVNMKKRHQRKRKQGEKGQILEKSLPIFASKVMVVDPKSGKRSRVGKKVMAGKKIRIARKSQQEI